MKKLLALLSATAVLVATSAFSAGATESKDLYKDKFEQRYSMEWMIMSKPDYKELYYHTSSQSGKDDWVLVYGDTHYEEPMLSYAVFGDRVVASAGMGVPFSAKYGIYDIATDEFIDLCKVWYKTDYEDLQSVCMQLKIGQPIGDVNNDKVLDIEDVTNIQKSLATIGFEAKNILFHQMYIILVYLIISHHLLIVWEILIRMEKQTSMTLPKFRRELLSADKSINSLTKSVCRG